MRDLAGVAVFLVCMTCGDALALAQTGVNGARRLSHADCEVIWVQAAQGNETLNVLTADAYVVNFGAVDKNLDDKISRTEFLEACRKGLVSRPGAVAAEPPSRGRPAPVAEHSEGRR